MRLLCFIVVSITLLACRAEPATPFFAPTATVQELTPIPMTFQATAVPASTAHLPTPPSATDNILYLTFDDGPSVPYTQQILDILARHEAHATFFVLGQNVAQHPELMTAIVAAGHTLGNHTQTHRSLVGLNKRDFEGEVLPVRELLGEHDSHCLRPPFGDRDAQVYSYASELDYQIVIWTVDTADWSQPGADAIVNTLYGNLKPGDIILLHDGGADRSQTVAAVARFLPELTAAGWQFDALVCPSSSPLPTPDGPVRKPILYSPPK